MKSKWHAYISFAKSGIRIIGCLVALFASHSIMDIAIAFLLAELLGIAEEIGDKR